jgi:hypothetical protein
MMENNEKVYFISKTLTIISKYGFINNFETCLNEIYKFSLSKNKIPLERYLTLSL